MVAGECIIKVCDEKGSEITAGVRNDDDDDDDDVYLVQPTDEKREGFKIYLHCRSKNCNNWRVICQPPSVSAFAYHYKIHHANGKESNEDDWIQDGARLIAAQLTPMMKGTLSGLKKDLSKKGGHKMKSRSGFLND